MPTPSLLLANDELPDVLESITDAFVAVDSQWRFTYMNAEAERVYRDTRENLLGRSLWEAFPDFVGSHFDLPFRRAMEDRVPLDVEGPYEPLGGFYEIRIRPTRSGGLTFYFRDVSDLHRTVDALRESETRFRKMFESNMIPMGVWSLDGGILDANEALLRLVGYTNSDLKNGVLNWAALTPPEFAHLDQLALREIESRGVCAPYVKQYRHCDGHRIPILVGACGVDSREQGVFFVLDLSEQNRINATLAEREATLRAFYESSPACMGVTEPTEDGDVIHLYDNPATCRFFGVAPGSTEGKWALADLHGDAAVVAKWREHYAASERLKGPVHFEHEYHTPCGRRWLSATVCSIGLGPAGQMRFCYVAEDVTDRKQAEQLLQEADRRKDEFIATLAHELRNPLAPIRNAVHILKAKDIDDPDLRWSQDVIERQVAHMARLLDDLLDVSRITRNKLELRTSRVAIASVVQMAIETSMPLLKAQNHAFCASLPDEPIYVSGDSVRLAQIFSNLLNNAAKYTDAGGRVELKVTREASRVRVSVRDNGIGIRSDMLPRVFEMFSQVESALDRSHGGLGIGLALVKGLVEMHGGTVEARSEGLGRGSEFSVSLPIAEAAMHHEVGPSQHQETNVAKCKVLVADDNEDSATTLALMLKLMGYDVRQASTGTLALQVAGEFRPDVALLDIGMPQLNGYEVARRIREQAWGKEMLLAALTGWGQEEDRRQSEQAGFNQHLVKPVEVSQLMQLLDRVKQRCG